VSLEQLNHYVLVAAAVFAVVLYVATMVTGFSEYMSRRSKRRTRPRPPGRGGTGRPQDSKRSSSTWRRTPTD
jgi:hypothetical protein